MSNQENKNTVYMGTREAAELWGVTQATVSNWCRNGKVKNAEQDAEGCPLRISRNAQPPIKRRKT